MSGYYGILQQMHVGHNHTCSVKCTGAVGRAGLGGGLGMLLTEPITKARIPGRCALQCLTRAALQCVQACWGVGACCRQSLPGRGHIWACAMLLLHKLQ